MISRIRWAIAWFFMTREQRERLLEAERFYGQENVLRELIAHFAEFEIKEETIH